MNIEGQPLLLHRNISGVWSLGSQWRREETRLWSELWGLLAVRPWHALLPTCRVLTCEMEASPARKFWNAFLTAGVFVLQRSPTRDGCCDPLDKKMLLQKAKYVHGYSHS